MLIDNTIKKSSIILTLLFVSVFSSSCKFGAENLTLTDSKTPLELTDGEEFQVVVPRAGCTNDIVYGGVTNYGYSQIAFTLVEKESKNIKIPDFEGEVEILTFSASGSGNGMLQLGCSILPDPSQGLTGGYRAYMTFLVNLK